MSVWAKLITGFWEHTLRCQTQPVERLLTNYFKEVRRVKINLPIPMVHFRSDWRMGGQADAQRSVGTERLSVFTWRQWDLCWHMVSGRGNLIRLKLRMMKRSPFLREMERYDFRGWASLCSMRVFQCVCERGPQGKRLMMWCWLCLKSVFNTTKSGSLRFPEVSDIIILSWNVISSLFNFFWSSTESTVTNALISINTIYLDQVFNVYVERN